MVTSDTAAGAIGTGSLLFDKLDLLTVEELADALRRAPKTIRNWVAKRQIPFVMLGRRVLFRRKSIETWLERKEFKSWQ